MHRTQELVTKVVTSDWHDLHYHAQNGYVLCADHEDRIVWKPSPDDADVIVATPRQFSSGNTWFSHTSDRRVKYSCTVRFNPYKAS